MRYFAVILSLYTLYLVSVPCIDKDIQSNKVYAAASGQNNPASSHEHSDGCSPFCICSCCSVQVVVVSGTIITQPFFIIQDEIQLKSADIHSSFIPEFHLPPKLA